MNTETLTSGPLRGRACAALRDALSRLRPDVVIDDRGYAPDFRDTLLPMVLAQDFEADLGAGDGNELQTKFRAAHSSSGLAVNCFAPFRSRMADLILPMAGPFDPLGFEQKCPTGLRGGRAPNLDILLRGATGAIGIESKLTEHMTPHRAVFSPAYAEQIRDERRSHGYFQEMLRLMDQPDSYVWLDAAQLIKHAFGLSRAFGDRPVMLLYLFWEPANPQTSPVFAEHRDEIARFAARVGNGGPDFVAMSYPELWATWRDAGPAGWLARHLSALQARYGVTL